MEIISNRPKEITVATDDQRSTAIMQRYGDADRMFTALMEQTEPKADTPELVLVMKEYGTDEVLKQLRTRMRIAVLRMDESILNDEEVSTIARGIVEDKDARTLGYDLVLDFFKKLEGGYYELYACKPRHIMAAWRQHVSVAASIQTRLVEAQERAQREAEQARHDAEYLRPEEFRRWKEEQAKKAAT